MLRAVEPLHRTQCNQPLDAAAYSLEYSGAFNTKLGYSDAFTSLFIFNFPSTLRSEHLLDLGYPHGTARRGSRYFPHDCSLREGQGSRMSSH